MEQTITFVLGATCGLGLFGLGYIIYIVLKMKKRVAALSENAQYIQQVMNGIETSLHQRIDNTLKQCDDNQSYLYRHIDNRTEDLDKIIGSNNADTHQRIGENYNSVMNRIDNLNRYVDSRLDKTTDSLCLRMDTMFTQKNTDTTLLKS